MQKLISLQLLNGNNVVIVPPQTEKRAGGIQIKRGCDCRNKCLLRGIGLILLFGIDQQSEAVSDKIYTLKMKIMHSKK